MFLNKASLYILEETPVACGKSRDSDPDKEMSSKHSNSNPKSNDGIFRLVPGGFHARYCSVRHGVHCEQAP